MSGGKSPMTDHFPHLRVFRLGKAGYFVLNWQYHLIILSNLHIKEPDRLWAVALYIRGTSSMHYSLNEENETVLYRQWFVIYKCPERHVWLLYSFVDCIDFVLQKVFLLHVFYVNSNFKQMNQNLVGSIFGRSSIEGSV